MSASETNLTKTDAASGAADLSTGAELPQPPLALPRLLHDVRRQVPDVPEETVIELDDVSVYYGAFRAVTEVSLAFGRREITALIGPSGCGRVDRAALPQPDERPGGRRPRRR